MKAFVRTFGSTLCNRMDDLETGAHSVLDEVNCLFSRDRSAYLLPHICVSAPVLGQPQLAWLPFS